MSRLIIVLWALLIHLTTFGQSNSINLELLSTLPEDTEIAVGVFENGRIEKQGFIVENGRLVSKENSKQLFEIGSITKVFTTLSALKILDRNRIHISSPIVEFLPQIAKNTSDSITFFKLMTHTSGIPKMPNNFIWSALRCPSDPFLHYCEGRMVRYLKEFNPKKNEGFVYSNLGMGLLGYTISKIDSSSLNRIMKREIFQPLRMESTSLGLSEEQFHLVVNSTDSNKEPKRTWEFSNVTEGAGNVYSNIDDMTTFLSSILMGQDSSCNTILCEMEKEQIQISELESMGLGWRIHRNKSEITYHGGITYGFKSLVAYNRLKERGIVILTNAKGLSRKENKILKEVCFEYL